MTISITICAMINIMSSNSKKISISLDQELVAYTESYRRQHNLKSRSEVISEAVRALRERELIADYRTMSEDYKERPDLWVDSNLADGLEPSTEESW